MPQYTNDDEDFEGEDNDSPLIKQLRKQLKDQKKELDDARLTWEKDREKLQKFEVGSVLTSKGISDARASKYLVADKIDLSDEAAVDKWLEENGDMFGYVKKEPEKQQELAEAFGQMQASESLGSPQGRQHEAITALEGTKNPEDVLNLLMGKYGNVTVKE